MPYKVYDRVDDRKLVALIAGILAAAPGISGKVEVTVEAAEKIVEEVGTRNLSAGKRRRVEHSWWRRRDRSG